jgi:hypothetical protein
MTQNPYHQNSDDMTILVNGIVRRAGISREGLPYLVVESKCKTFYLFVQSDAEGNGAGYLSITESSGVKV